MKKIILGLLIILVVGCVSFLVGYHSHKMDEVVNNYSFNKDNFSLAIAYSGEAYKMQIYILSNGVLYYKIVDDIKEPLENGNYYMNYLNETNEEFHMVEGLENIKRIKGANTVSTGVFYNLIAILDSGEVYEIINQGHDSFSVRMIDDFKDFKVDDILEYEAANGCVDGMVCESTYKIVLKNGKVLERK